MYVGVIRKPGELLPASFEFRESAQNSANLRVWKKIVRASKA